MCKCVICGKVVDARRAITVNVDELNGLFVVPKTYVVCPGCKVECGRELEAVVKGVVAIRKRNGGLKWANLFEADRYDRYADSLPRSNAKHEFYGVKSVLRERC